MHNATVQVERTHADAARRTRHDAGRAVAVAVVEGFLDLLCDTRQYALLATCVAYCTVYYTRIHAASRRVWSLDALHTSRRHCWATRHCDFFIDQEPNTIPRRTVIIFVSLPILTVTNDATQSIYKTVFYMSYICSSEQGLKYYLVYVTEI